MEPRRYSLSVRGPMFFLLLTSLLEHGSAGIPVLYPMNTLCKFCDLELSSCTGTGTCMTNCSITSICAHNAEVCVAIWRKNETSYSIETLCHDPSRPLYGVMLDDYNSSTCVMKEKNTTTGPAYLCSCTEEEEGECNDKLLFPPNQTWLPDRDITVETSLMPSVTSVVATHSIKNQS